MNELSEGYSILQAEINILNHSERDLNRIQSKIQDISKRAKDLKNLTERDYKYAHDYFERIYKIPPSEVANEIRRLENDYKTIIENTNNADKDLHIEKMKDYEFEYKLQIERAKISPDHKEILENLTPSQIVTLERERYNHERVKTFYDLER